MNDSNRNDDDGNEGESPSENKLLEEFRQQWKKELKTDELAVVKNNDDNVSSTQKIDEDKVKEKKLT